ncbi:hypothetical protein ACLOJK_035294 [Asimina triloba]
MPPPIQLSSIDHIYHKIAVLFCSATPPPFYMYTVDLDDNDVKKKAKNIILEILLTLPPQRHHTLITYPAFLHRYRSYDPFANTRQSLCMKAPGDTHQYASAGPPSIVIMIWAGKY